MKLATAAVCAALCAASANAQKLELKFDALAAKASSKTEIDLDGVLLKLAARMARDADVSGLMAGVQAVHIRNYEFARDGAYSQNDLASLRNQVAAQSRWSKILNVKEDETTTEIYVAAQDDKVSGCLVVSAGDRELSILYVEGSMALAQMRRLMDEDTRRDFGALFEKN